MVTVTFCNKNEVLDEKFLFAVIAAKHGDKWVLCRHKERTTWEIPGGHREKGESIDQTARRELVEETGAFGYTMYPLTAYCVNIDGEKTYGMLYLAEVNAFTVLSDESEIGEIKLFEALPAELTYPAIQPFLFDYALKKQSLCYSYVMGANDRIFSLKEDGFTVERDGENYTVSFPKYKAFLWEGFMRKHLQVEYWNEYICNNTAVFLFQLQDGIKRFEVENFENTEVLHLCETLCGCKFDSIKTMLTGNWYYKKVLEEYIIF